MGMFDEIEIKCPHCGKITIEQSKASHCLLDRYNLENAPTSILEELEQCGTNCQHCGKHIHIEIKNRPFGITY